MRRSRLSSRLGAAGRCAGVYVSCAADGRFRPVNDPDAAGRRPASVVNSLLCGDYQVGDIVIAHKETFDSKPIVKRVIATAGQTVDIDFNLGQVYVDGELLDEDYINDYTYREEGTVFPLTVPEGEVFLMGDNRNHSNDSRDSSLGTVDTRLLIGKAVFLVFPGRDYLTEQREFGRIGLLQ